MLKLRLNILQTLSEAHSQTEKLKMQLVALENINGGIEAKEMNYLMQVGLQERKFFQQMRIVRISMMYKVSLRCAFELYFHRLKFSLV